VKPLGSRVAVANAPASAYGRAALSDNGTIELYRPAPPGSFAECDTTSTNIPDDATVDPGTAHLTASCSEGPTATAAADGALPDSSGGGNGSSRATGDGSGDAATASSIAIANDVTVGPVVIGSARYEASAATDGTRERASGAGRVTVSNATVNGTPVVIGPDGVAVDQDKVPAELVNAATLAVQKALGQGGYLNVRAAQPEVTIADDGSSVAVRGGGVFFEGKSNDPEQPYFLRQTLVGGSLLVAVGAPVSGGAVVTPPAPPPDGPGSPAATGDVATRPSGDAGLVAASPATPELITQRTVHRTRPVGLAWLWLVVIALAVMGVTFVFRRRLTPAWERVAERYLRG
jgi:hypothetical protein